MIFFIKRFKSLCRDFPIEENGSQGKIPIVAVFVFQLKYIKPTFLLARSVIDPDKLR